MKRWSLPREKNEYIPSGIYSYPQAERKEAFLKLFSLDNNDDVINKRRMENLKELRGDYR